MDLANNFNGFTDKGWEEKVLEGDKLWAQVKAMLAENNLALPRTPRRPDIRLIINNLSGNKIRFRNPGVHSGNKEETIPAAGDKSAIMVMLTGDTLEAQQKNSDDLYSRYNLGVSGLSPEFLQDMKDGELSGLVSEAYGPAPFAGQAEKLVEVDWVKDDGSLSKSVPVKGAAAAYGARAATNEVVFLAKFNIYVKGSTTTPELVESSGMAIAISEDWQTKAETTRPIVPSVAKTYYGAHFANMPEVTVHPDGKVVAVNLKNDTIVGLDNTGTKTVLRKAAAGNNPKPR